VQTEQRTTRTVTRIGVAVAVIVGPVLAVTVFIELRGRPSRAAIASIRGRIHLGMDEDVAKGIINDALHATAVHVAAHDASPQRDYVRVDTGLASSWLLVVEYADGRVARIRAATEDGPAPPRGFPPNEP
jgi:hypothetical protein